MKKTRFKVGDYVKVRDGVKDPDFENYSLAGWVGRIYEIEEDSKGTVILFKLDQATLKKIPPELQTLARAEDLDVELMSLLQEDLEPCPAPPKEVDISFSQKSREKSDPEGDDDEPDEFDGFMPDTLPKALKTRLKEVFLDGEPSTFNEALVAWRKYLKGNLQFPFNAKFDEEFLDSEEESEILSVTGLGTIDQYDGLTVQIAGREGHTPLIDLQTVETDSKTGKLVADYGDWFFGI